MAFKRGVGLWFPSNRVVCGLEQLNLRPGFSGGWFLVSSEMAGHSTRQHGSQRGGQGSVGLAVHSLLILECLEQ